jgi:hypothetical protein
MTDRPSLIVGGEAIQGDILECSLNVPWMYLNVPCMFPECALNVL